MESSREYQQDIFICFIDYKKAFDCVDHGRMWITLKDMGVPMHLIVLLKNLYVNQEATVRTEFGETDKIDIGKGVRQGCILSPILFTICAEREALVDYNGVRIGGLRLTDDVVLHHTLPVFTGLEWCPIVSWDFCWSSEYFWTRYPSCHPPMTFTKIRTHNLSSKSRSS